MRIAVDNPKRWERFIQAIDVQLSEGNPEAFLRAFEHGYGRPPQALDVRTAEVTPGQQRIYRAAFDDGDAIAPEAVPLPEGTDSGPSA
jgi:hypothetical protein